MPSASFLRVLRAAKPARSFSSLVTSALGVLAIGEVPAPNAVNGLELSGALDRDEPTAAGGAIAVLDGELPTDAPVPLAEAPAIPKISVTERLDDAAGTVSTEVAAGVDAAPETEAELASPPETPVPGALLATLVVATFGTVLKL